MIRLTTLSTSKRWLPVAAIWFVSLGGGLLFSAPDAQSSVLPRVSSETACTPRAPYYMLVHNGDPYISKPGIGGIGIKILKLIKPSYVNVYRVRWHVNKGFAICRAEVKYRTGQIKKLNSGLQRGHWDYDDNSRSFEQVVVWVRRARTAHG